MSLACGNHLAFLCYMEHARQTLVTLMMLSHPSLGGHHLGASPGMATCAAFQSCQDESPSSALNMRALPSDDAGFLSGHTRASCCARNRYRPGRLLLSSASSSVMPSA